MKYKSYLHQYHDYVEKGKVLVNDDIRKAIALEKEKLKLFDFDVELVDYAIDWIEEYCRLVTGSKIGKKMRLTLTQKWILSGIFGFWGMFEIDEYKDGQIIGKKEEYLRVTNDVLIMVASGFGKTTFVAAINALLLYTDVMVGTQIFIGSNAYKQSRLCFDITQKMIKKSVQMKKLTRFRGSIGEIEVESLDGKLVAMSSEGDNFEGIEPSVIILDEVHAMKTSKYADDLKKSTKRDDLLMIDITTQGTVRGGYLDERIDYFNKVLNKEIVEYRKVAYLFHQDSIEEVIEAYNNEDYVVFTKSNPNIGETTSAILLKDKVKEMIENPQKRSSILTKNFNIPQNPSSIYFSALECQTKIFDESILIGKPVFLGLDMAYTSQPTNDLTALTIHYYNPSNDRVYYKDYAFLPKYYLDEQQHRHDMVSAKSKEDSIDYQLFIDRGDVILIDDDRMTEQFMIDFIQEKIMELQLNVLKFGLDPNKANNIISHFNNITNNNKFCIEFRSERKVWTTPIIEQTKEERNQQLVHCNNKLTEIHFASVTAKKDSNGYIVLENKQRERKDLVISHLAANTARTIWCGLSDKSTGVLNKAALAEVISQIEGGDNECQI